MESWCSLHLFLKPLDNMKIQIPAPCDENWEAMTPNNKGAFCSACEKTVIDFSKMTDEEISYYFTSHANTKICGRFRIEQLVQPEESYPLFQQVFNKTFYSKFFMVTLLGLCSSLYACVSNPKKDIKIPVKDTAKTYSTPIRTIGIVSPPDSVCSIPPKTDKPPKLRLIDTTRYELGEPAFITDTLDASRLKKNNK